MWTWMKPWGGFSWGGKDVEEKMHAPSPLQTERADPCKTIRGPSRLGRKA